MNAIDALSKKYDIYKPDLPAPQPEERQREQAPIQSWKDYPRIQVLSDFIKANKAAGFSIAMVNGDPAVRFEPGLKCNDPRWDLALQAENLLFAAADDIRYFVDHGLMDLPAINRIYHDGSALCRGSFL